MSSANLVADLARLTDGPIIDSETEMAAFAVDYGGTVERTPKVVVRPTRVEELARVIKHCYAQDLVVSFRAGGFSFSGQSLNQDGVVIDMRGLSEVGPYEPSEQKIWCQAGATWKSLLEATLPQGQIPPVLTSYLGATIGGTMSAAGFGNASFLHGTQIDQCAELEVVLHDGEIVRCNEQENRELFEHALGGFGQFGAIARACHRLRPIQPCVRTYYLRFDDLESHLAAHRMLLEDRRAHFVDAMIRPCLHGVHLRGGRPAHLYSFVYPMSLSVEAESFDAIDDQAILGDLGFSKWVYANDYSTPQFVTLGAEEQTPSFKLAQVFTDVLAPWSTLGDFIRKVETFIFPNLVNVEHVRLGAVATSTLRRPMLKVPDDPMAMGIGLYTAVPKSYAETNLQYSQSFVDLGVRNGGCYYLIGSVRLDTERLAKHFGDAWPALCETKRKYDPKGLLNPGCFAWPGD